MIAILAPSKTLNTFPFPAEASTLHRFPKETTTLVNILKKYNVESLMELMSISKNLAEQNFERYQSFDKEFTSMNSSPAIMAFKGEAYLGLNPASFDTEDLAFAQNHLRILSGLYGLLRPLDLMQAYRLEMGTTLATSQGKNLYEFWSQKISKLLSQDLIDSGSPYLINLASQEYFKSLTPNQIKGTIINIEFKEIKNGALSFNSFNAKKARGMMCHYMIKNKLDSPEDLKSFTLENYKYSEENSDKTNFLFIK